MSAPQTDFRPDNLRCEYHVNPLGIEVARPRLAWKLISNRRGARQTAYQVLVASSEALLNVGTGNLWDSGKVASDQTVHVDYGGRSLVSGERAWWQVRGWDEHDAPSEYAAPAWWEMGLRARDDWQGNWIGASLVGGPRASVPAPYLRKAFVLDKPVASARLYVTALGVYECSLNGQRVGSDYFAPGWTDYRKHIQYQVYDVTALLTEGENVLGATLGDGWYCGYVAHKDRQNYGDRPKLRAMLVIHFAGETGEPADAGNATTIVTDVGWKTTFGPIIESDFLMGESYDARLELGPWDKAGYDDSKWANVETFPETEAVLVAMRGPAVRTHEELTPIAEPTEIPQWPASKYLFDMGQNMVGIVSLKVRGPRGTTVTLRFAEVLDANGQLYTANLRSARQTDYYTLRGSEGDEPDEIYTPHFTSHGFRYVEVSGFPGKPTRDTLTGIVLHSDTPPTGTFECSDDWLNKLQHNIVWGQKGNFLDVPTDCPQRDERLGWTGDAQVFIRTAAFNADVAAFFTRWMRDVSDAQNEHGEIPPVVPNIDLGGDGGPAWADAVIICPWTIYLCYGDTRLLAEQYATMTRYLARLEATAIGFIRCHPDNTPWGGFGDWLSINAETPSDLIGTAFFAHCAHLMHEIARVLNKPDDAARYAALFENVKRAFQERFVTASGFVASQTQTAYCLALHFDLLPEALRPFAANALAADIRKRGTHLSTGFVGSPYLAHVLTDAGKLDLAYELLHQKTWPSWLYAVTQGATTIWERWDGWTHDKGFQDPAMNSFNHYAYGAIGAWLYSVVAGIDIDPSRPGYQHVRLHPRPGGGCTAAKATLETVHGRVVSDWKLEGGSFLWNVTLPPNTTATVTIPCKPDADITEGWQSVAEAEGVTVVGEGNGEAVFEIISGTYGFASAL